jgi:hypothetical protein
MSGLSADLTRRLREVLLRCGPFDSNRSLRAVFVDGRIHAWRELVPEAASRAERVDAVIDKLLDRADPQGVPALALLAEVLADRVSPGDACHHSLARVSVELRDAAELCDAAKLRDAVELRNAVDVRPAPGPEPSSIETGGGAYIGGNVGVGEGGVFVGRDVHGDVVTGSKTTTFDQRGQEVQQQTNVAGDYHDRRGGPTYITHIEHATGIAIGDGAHAGGPPVRDPGAATPGAAPQLPALRASLQRLDDVALDTLCMDYFPDVYDRFSRGMRRDEKANLLLDHCRRHAQEMARLVHLLNA